MKIKVIIGAVSLACLSMPVSATDLFVEGGVHFGGDTLASTSGGSSEDLKAGQLLSLAMGVYTEINDSLQGRLSLGYKFDSISASNGDATFTRLPIEGLVMYQTGNFMVGGGLAYHLSPKFDFSATPSFTINFDDALGLVLGFDYNSKGKFQGDWFVGGRVTLIDYEVPGLTVSGNSIGAVVGYMF